MIKYLDLQLSQQGTVFKSLETTEKDNRFYYLYLKHLRFI